MSYLAGVQCGVMQFVFIVLSRALAVTDPNRWTLGIMKYLWGRKKINQNNAKAVKFGRYT